MRLISQAFAALGNGRRNGIPGRVMLQRSNET